MDAKERTFQYYPCNSPKVHVLLDNIGMSFLWHLWFTQVTKPDVYIYSTSPHNQCYMRYSCMHGACMLALLDPTYICPAARLGPISYTLRIAYHTSEPAMLQNLPIS